MMAKSRAEIQKDYRERKKAKEGKSYLAKECQRRMKYYVKTESLTRREKTKRQEVTRENVRRYRQRKKAAQALAAQEVNEGEGNVGDVSTSGYDTGEKLVVRLNFDRPGRREGPRKRTSRALSRAHRTIQKLKESNLCLERRLGTVRRRADRYRKKIKLAAPAESPKTPRSRTQSVLKEAGPCSARVRKELLFGNVLLEELGASKKASLKNRNKTKTLQSLISGKVMKKYRCLNMLSKRTGFARRTLSIIDSKWKIAQNTRKRLQHRYRESVISFLERDDNSRAQPGKADCAKNTEGEKVQTRVLTDYMNNLHAKFRSENPAVEMSLATFCRIRPKHIQTTSFISRSCCLCTKHQNMALLLKAVRREGATVPLNPETYLKDGLDETAVIAALPDEVKFGQWTRVKVEEKGKVKSIMKIVDTTLPREEFIKKLRTQTEEFSEHVSRLRTQYEQIRLLKETLPEHDMIVHMDFAENYSCKNVEEIQSAYWNKTGVTLHPTVVYYRDAPEGDLKHRSFVFVSDEMTHSTPTVHAILDKLLPQLKEIDPQLATVHYWTDGPTSQYRNKVIFETVANHESIYKTKARWNYFESGHGKGPCDGLGGTAKRMADEAVNSGKVAIQDAHGFFEWAKQSSMKSVTFCFVSSQECQAVAESLKKKTLKPVKGTFKLHAVVGLGNSRIAIRDVSCYCDACMTGTLCNTWDIVAMECVRDTKAKGSSEIPSHPGSTSVASAVRPAPMEVDVTRDLEVSTATDVGVTLDPEAPAQTALGVTCDPEVPATKDVDVTCHTGHNDYSTGEFVAAVYISNSKPSWYIGRVVCVDEDDKQVEISFLEKRKSLYQWPRTEDVIWVEHDDVLCAIHDPTPTGKSGRMLKISDQDYTVVEQKFAAWKERS